MVKSVHFGALRRLAAVAAAFVAVAALAACEPAPNDPPPPPPDGLTSVSSAASCWEIKDRNPSAGNGVYWLSTPTLGAPEQFYCDMTTDGGGWVLVGRGRNAWNFQYQGQGTAAEVRDVIDGPGAFSPRALSAKTIDGLLDNGRVDALTEGIRLRRATTPDGTGRQEARFKMAKLDRWAWTFPATHPVGDYSFDASTGFGGQTIGFGLDFGFRGVYTFRSESQAFNQGFSYGPEVPGSTASTSYLWSNTDGLGGARPFTQMFIRPRLRSADRPWLRVPDNGLPAQARTPLLVNGVSPAPWGVTGLGNGVDGELNSEVQAFAQIGSRVYVAGNLRYVQQDAAGTGRVEQRFLAAFDVTTGQWISTFRPQLNGQVKDLAALPNGRLVAAGEFTQANGQPALGTVALDAATGTTDTGWRLNVENRITGGTLSVRALDVQGPWLYLGGAFTHLAGGSRINSPVYARGAARVALTDATPDAGWNPNFNGTAVDIDASAAGDRLYAAGYFSQSNTTATQSAAAIRTDPGAAALAWSPVWSDGTNYQQAILESGDRVWVGGAQHSFFSFDRTTFERRSGNITTGEVPAGGDFQAAEEADGMVYGACHCNDFNYSDAYVFRNLGNAWTRADKIGFIGAWNKATGAIDPEFSPQMKARQGIGPWAEFRDSTGTLWAGGDMVSAVRPNGTTQWVGGFVRFAPRDTTVPTRPGNLSSTPISSSTTRLTWTGSSDVGETPRYQVLRNDRVVATTTTTLFDVPTPAAPTRYFVRAVDSTGNRSATTPVHVVPPA